MLHAGVAVVALHLLRDGEERRARLVGAALLAGLVVKVVLEDPFGPVLRTVPEAGLAVAPFAHLSGAVAGLACAVLARAAASMRAR